MVLKISSPATQLPVSAASPVRLSAYTTFSVAKVGELSMNFKSFQLMKLMKAYWFDTEGNAEIFSPGSPADGS